MIRLYAIAILTLLVGSVASVACDKVPLTSPTGSTITLSIDRDILPVNGQATVKAVVMESAGTAPQNGTMVTFQPSIGRTEPIDAPTINGVATVTFLAGSVSGSGVIHAFSGSARTGSGNSSAGGVSVQIGSAAVGSVSLNVVPASIPQSGGAVSVTALVLDSGSNPLPGVAVNFSTDQGTLGNTTVFSDQSGRASTTLQTNRPTVVTATVGSQKGTFTVTVISAPTVVVSCPAGTPAAPNPVGVPITCTITPTAPASGSAISNVTVNWGDGSGEQPLGNVTGATTVSHTYTSPGSYTVTASATDQNGQRGTGSTTLVVTRVLPTATLTVPATGTAGVAVSMSVDPPANPSQPISNVTVDFGDGTSRNLGAISGPTSFTKTYGSEGGFTVTATITDASGQRGSTSKAIVISQSQLTVTLTGPATLALNASGNFTVTASSSTAGVSIRTVEVIDLDNGNRVLYSGTAGGAFSASFNSTGTHTLQATATDSSGNTGRARHLVNVQ